MRRAVALLILAAICDEAFAQTPESILPGIASLPVLQGDRLVATLTRENRAFVETPAHLGQLADMRLEEYVAALQSKGWVHVPGARGKVFRRVGDDAPVCIDVGGSMAVGVDAAATEPVRYGITFARRACPTLERPY